MTKQLIGIDSKLLPLKVLKETPGNPQQMDEKTFSGMVKSMKEKGWILDGPTIWEKGENDYQIISGHHRVQAGIEAGIVETQCKVIKGITEEQAKILVLEANQRKGSFDDEILNIFIDDLVENYDYNIDEIIDEVGFDDNIYNIINSEPEEKDDEIPEVVEKFSQLGDLYLLNNHRVLCGDSTDEKQVELLMDGKKANLIMTSPPYWVGKDYEAQETEKDVNDFIEKIVKNISCIMNKDYSRIVINSGTGMATRLKEKNSRVVLLLDKWVNGLFNNDWYLRNIRHWLKRGGSPGPISAKNDFVYSGLEYLMTFYNTKGTQRGQNKISQSWAQQPDWNNIQGDKQENKAGFPVELPLRFILLYSLKNEIVSDIFLGNGTTLIACEKTNRTCYGMELDPYYIDVIIKRYINYTGSTDNCFLIRDNEKIPLRDIKEL